VPSVDVIHFVRLYTCAAGISLKTQKLLLIVFCCRYLDLFTTHYIFYNTSMKLLYIALTFSTIMLIRFHPVISITYEKSKDTFPMFRYALLPCMVLLVVRSYYEIHPMLGLEVSVEWVQDRLWKYSIYVEAVAMLPQLLVMEVRLFTICMRYQ
jgi:ER lumen protein retaining receptor